MNKQNQEKASLWLKIMAWGALFFLHFPLLIVILYAFTTEEASFSFPPPALTSQWFGTLWERQDFWDAFWLSMQVAGTATLIAMVLGTVLAAALYRSKFFGRDVISLLVILPIALPGIVTAIALRSAMSLSGVQFSFWTIVIGHATFCIVTVYNNVIARLRRTQHSQIEASFDLGGTPFQTFRYIILPNIASALLAGGMLAFALSFDEIIVTTFTSGNESTLPIWIFNQLVRRPNDRPVTNVAALLVIVVTFIPIILAYRLSQRSAGEES